MNKLLSALVASAIILCGAPASAQKTPEKIRLTGTSKDGAVLIRVPAVRADYALMFSKDGKSGFLSRAYMMKVPGNYFSQSGFRYIARTLAPGRYRLDSVWQQATWSGCLAAGTLEFDVKPGEISYLGTLNAQELLESVQAQAVQKGRTVLGRGDIFVAHEGIAKPFLSDRSEAGVADARTFAQTNMNGTGDLLKLGQVGETSFAVSKASRAIEVCG
jgi:hypothetical protein